MKADREIVLTNKNDADYERMFDAFINEVFGFSFAPWFAEKVWDERYESYSIIQDNRILSNACIYKTDMLVGGQTIRANQFGAVATRESERGKGLSRMIISHILSLYPDTPAFLYANPNVTEFYPLFGFRRVNTYRPVIAAEINNPIGSAKTLSPKEVLSDSFKGRGVFSGVVDDTNTQPIQAFHLLLDYARRIYYLPDCGAVVVAEQESDRLFLADVITKQPIAFETLRKELPFTGVKYVEFGFCPDWLGIEPCWEPVDAEKEPFFIRGDWTLPDKFRFPVMSVT